jgi:hypothetical protein
MYLLCVTIDNPKDMSFGLSMVLQIFALLLNFALLFEINCTEINQSLSSNIFMYTINLTLLLYYHHY